VVTGGTRLDVTRRETGVWPLEHTREKKNVVVQNPGPTRGSGKRNRGKGGACVGGKKHRLGSATHPPAMGYAGRDKPTEGLTHEPAHQLRSCPQVDIGHT